MDDRNSNDHVASQAIRILDYWHKIEFFESTNIKDLEDNAAGVLRLTEQDLLDPAALPWISPQQVRAAGAKYSSDKKYNYELFFGIFDRSEIFDRARQKWPEDIEERKERYKDEGRTCSIKCFVDNRGCIDVQSFEFSTVTWALGQLETTGLEGVTFAAFEQETDLLRQRFQQIVTIADNLKKEHELPPFLTTFEIIEFLKSLSQWTTFTPDIPAPALYIKLKEVKNQKARGNDETSQIVTAERLNALNRLQPILTGQCTVATSSSKTADAGDIAILNSFYLRDIERVVKSIKESGLKADSPLGRYLTGSGERQSDLLTQAGRTLLLEKLQLSQLPAGRWPSDCAHNMSLMQQFAINTINSEIAQSGLYSVNGPPGTGKTTMLRDIIAQNIVKRASILAGLNQPSDAIAETFTLNVSDRERAIPRLLPELAGFEMVVVSSNNAAVENISRELPQRKSLGETWQESNYLKSAAQKLAAPGRILEKHEQKDDKIYQIKPLTAEKECWGLIAAALGKQDNREHFGQRLFFHTAARGIAEKPADRYCTLSEAIRALPDNTFSEAKTTFLAAQEKLRVILTELQLLESLPAHKEACEQQAIRLNRHHVRLLRLNARLTKRRARKPSWWSLQIKRLCREKAIVAALERRQMAAEARYKLESERAAVSDAALKKRMQQCAVLEKKYPDAIFAESKTDIDAVPFQRTSPGHCKALNEARTELTLQALALHQAWLSTGYKEGYLRDAVFVLMKAINGTVADKKIGLALWQLFFMIVPVVSSTFASVNRQFSAFSGGDIGWLFIDEAGQATPQQAAGALWRARRAVVVGDPLQIEPVFTIPPAFVEAVAKREFGEGWSHWSPTVQSVQNLADRVNPYGTRQITKESWLGSPLRVHRRCDEPMFSIANAIAYNNKMLHGRDNLWPQDTFIWGNSRWIDVRGAGEGKHYVPEQARYVLGMLHDWLKEHSELPDVYIISPFKEVKRRLKSYLMTELKGIKDSGKWVSERIGTVHTFQGKEEKNVIFVLGLALDNRGASAWASAKPNLLNVAITRAQKRVYIIGNREIWSGCPYFNVAHDRLSSVPESESLSEVN